MRIIKVKSGTSKYTLRGDDGTVIGELAINYARRDRTCGINLVKLGDDMKEMAIRVVG